MVNSQSVKAEMSVATPKSQAKEPIQLDIVVVCRKQQAAGGVGVDDRPDAVPRAIDTARAKLQRLGEARFRLSRNDRRIVVLGQLLTVAVSADEIDGLAAGVDLGEEVVAASVERRGEGVRQGMLF